MKKTERGIELEFEALVASGACFISFLNANQNELNDDYLDCFNDKTRKGEKIPSFPEFCYLAMLRYFDTKYNGVDGYIEV